MRRVCILVFVMLSCCFICSCAKNERKVSYSKSSTQSGLSKYESDVKFVRGKDGSVKPNKDKRSQFDNKSRYLGSRDFRGKNYATDQYRKERWSGNQTYENKRFGGGTDGSRFKYSPEFVQQQARVQGKVARAGGEEYGTAAYNVGANNRAQNAKRFDRPSDAETDVRRKVYKQPLVIEKDDYAGLSVEDSKRLLGR